jgi:DNA-binding response OmpR family regulator
VRNLGKAILTRFGYSVLTAGSGKEGIELFVREKARIDLVILDLIMPEMSGRDCLREIVKIAPSTRIIIVSGYDANGYIDQALEEGAKASLAKPYETRLLLETVRNILDEQES